MKTIRVVAAVIKAVNENNKPQRRRSESRTERREPGSSGERYAEPSETRKQHHKRIQTAMCRCHQCIPDRYRSRAEAG